jgi:hypothetical protein
MYKNDVEMLSIHFGAVAPPPNLPWEYLSTQQTEHYMYLDLIIGPSNNYYYLKQFTDPMVTLHLHQKLTVYYHGQSTTFHMTS